MASVTVAILEKGTKKLGGKWTGIPLLLACPSFFVCSSAKRLYGVIC